jgi:hypothetical protein
MSSLPDELRVMEARLNELKQANLAANRIISQQANEMKQLADRIAALEADEARLDWLAANPLRAHIGGLPASAKAYSIITELPLRAALDVMIEKESAAKDEPNPIP